MDEKTFISPSATPEPSISLVSKKSPSGLIVKIIIGTVIAVVVLAGIFLITRSLRSSPEKIVEKMIANMEKVKTLRSEIKMDIALMGEDVDEEINISLGLNADSDATSPERPKTAAEFDAVFTIPVFGQIPQVIKITGENRTIDEISYFRLNALDIPDELGFFLMMFVIDKSGLEKQWIKLEEKDLEGLGLESQLSLEEQLILAERISELLKEKKIYYVKKKLPEQEINGKKAYHYLLGIDEENLSEVIKEALKIISEHLDEEFSGTAEIGISFVAAGIAESVKESLKKINGLDIEIWIGKKDNYLYKFNLEKYIDSSAFIEDSEFKALIRFSAVFSNFNQPVKIEAPESFIGIEEIISSFSPSLFNLPNGTQEINLPPGIQELPFKYPFERSILEQGVGLYGLQASLLEILSDLLK